MGMKRFYTDYVNHMLRFYCKSESPWLPDTHPFCENQNWEACNTVFCKLAENEREILNTLYCQKTMNLAPVIKGYTIEHPTVTEDYIWSLVGRVTKMVASERGLI